MTLEPNKPLATAPEDSALGLYERFLNKLGQLTDKAYEKYSDSMACKAGCFSCCRNDFRISLIEALYLRQAIEQLPEQTRQTIERQSADSAHKQCALLVDGQCSVYDQRPVLCRVFGFPLTDGNTLATCELNFTDQRDGDFTSSAFHMPQLTENTQVLSKLALQELGQQNEQELPLFYIDDLIQQPNQ